MEVNFLNQNSCMPSWPGVFQFSVFSGVLRKSMCISTFSPSSSCISFPMLIIHSSLLLCSLGRKICLAPKLFCFPSLVVGMSSCLLPPTCWLNFFRCFGMSWKRYRNRVKQPCFDIFFIFLLSPVISVFSPSCHFYLCCFVHIFPTCSSFFLLFIIFACRRRILICVSSRIFHPGFKCLFVVLRGLPIFSLTYL